jgi:ImcF (intracellular multiplication and macrophage-killing)-related protein
VKFFGRVIEIVCYPFQLLFAAPVALLTASRAVRGFSLAARAALAVAVFMVLLTVVATLLSSPLVRQDSPDMRTILQTYTLPLTLFTIVTPPVVYLAVWLWGEGRSSRFPDIDKAWQEGVAALAREGLSLAEAPVFLVTGLRNERQVRAFMNAAGLQYAVFGAPEGGANPLYFYAVKNYALKKDESWNVIFLMLTDTSQASKLVSLAMESAGRERAVRPPEDTVRLNDMRETRSRGGGDTPRVGTLDQLKGTVAAPGAPPPPVPQFAKQSLRGTMDLGDMRGGTPSTADDQREMAVLLDKTDQTRQAERLEHVCRLLERARDPYCTLNGVLVVTPFGLLRRGPEQVRHLANATRQDLRTIQKGARIRCPVLSLIGGMEHEAGFGELVRRVGTGPALEQRIGMRFEPWNPATRERLEALAIHACDRIEGNVYDLFKMQDGYNKPGNTKLYNLLCRTRTGFSDLLKSFLAGAFGQQDPEERPMLFLGCYFAATGETERIQGFLKAVLVDRMLENQDDLQWTDEALQQDAARETWSRVGMLASGILVIATGVLVYRFLR